MSGEIDSVADLGDAMLALEAEMKRTGRQTVDAPDVLKRIQLHRHKMRRYHKAKPKSSRLKKFCLHKGDGDQKVDEDMLSVIAYLLAKHLFQDGGAAPVIRVARICELTADKSRGFEYYHSLVHEMTYACILKVTSRPFHDTESYPLVCLSRNVLKDAFNNEVLSVDGVVKEIRIRKNRDRRNAKRRRSGKKGEDNS